MINEIRKRLRAGFEVELECVDMDGLLTNNISACDVWKDEVKKGVVRVFHLDEALGRINFFSRYSAGLFLLYEDLKYFKIKEKEMSYSEKLINKDSKFQELLAAASYAVARGKLSSFIVNDMDCSDKIGNALYLGLNMTYHAIENEIKGINEMIDESSVVEQEVEEIKEVGFDDLIDVAVQAYKDGVLTDMELDESGLSSSQVMCFFSAHQEDIIKSINEIKSLYTEKFVIESQDCIERIDFIDGKITLQNGESLSDKEFEDILDFSDPLLLKVLKGATVTQPKGDK